MSLDLTELLNLSPSPIRSQGTKIENGTLFIVYCKLPGEKSSPISHNYDDSTRTLRVFVNTNYRYQIGSASGREVIPLPSDVARLEVVPVKD